MSGGINGPDDASDQSVEDEILNSVQDITGDDFDGDDDNEPVEEDTKNNRKPAADEEEQEELTNEELAAQAAKSSADDTRNRVDRTDLQKRIPSQRRVDYDYDQKTGDVINPKTGEVIFKNGAVEREMFTQLRDTQYKAHQADQKMREYVNYGKKVEQELEAYKRAPSVGESLKLNTEDQVRAFNMMAAYKADPVKAFRKMLTEFQVDGGDLTDIFSDLEKIQTEGLEAKIAKLLEPIIKPKQEEAASATQHQELVAKLNTEVTTFFGNNPEAEPHADLLAHVINRAAENGQRLSLSDAWVNVLKFANARKLDLSGDLRTQLDPPQQQQQREQRRPMPNGRANTSMQRRDERPSHERRSKDIVAEAMREAGFDV